MSKSVAKRSPNASNVCLPFAHPMKTTDGSIVWPFLQKGFPLFEGFTNFMDKCVDIRDETSVISLHNMGFFGTDPHLRTTYDTKQRDDSRQTVDSRSRPQRDPKYLNGKYVLIETSLPMALSEDIFSDNKGSDKADKCDTNPSTSAAKECGTDSSDDQSKNVPNVLKLSFMESFFISYVFGSLNVMNTETKNYLTIDDMWETFGTHYSEDKLEFAVHYSAYHYLRSKGWVVRNGTTFGTHFLLYKEGPHLYHSLYSVIIQYAIDGHYKQSVDWFYMSALVRLQRNVRKELMVCVVDVPKDCDISSPNCIKSFEIDFLSFNRWNASKGLKDLEDD